MLTKTIIGAAIAATAFIASPALAQYPYDNHSGYTGNWSSGGNWDRDVAPNGSGGGGAYWSYCPPRTVPQTFPNGNGYRCVDPNWP